MTAPTDIPGEPDAIEESAAALERAATALVDARDDFGGHVRPLIDCWRGHAASTAAASLEHPGFDVASTAERFRAVAPVLRWYAGELRAAQLQGTDSAADHALLANRSAARQVETGAVPVAAQASPASGFSAGGSGLAGVMADIGNVLASVGNAALHDPLAVAGVVGGVALTTASVAGFAGGLVADATGAGAVVGIPAGVASAAGVVTGVGLVGAGAYDLAHHAVTDDRVTPFQVNAEGEHPSNAPSEITGLTRHGSDRAHGRDGGRGVSDEAMEDAVENPTVPVREQEGGRFYFEGEGAVVVLNGDGEVITTWPTNRKGWRNP